MGQQRKRSLDIGLWVWRLEKVDALPAPDRGAWGVGLLDGTAAASAPGCKVGRSVLLRLGCEECCAVCHSAPLLTLLAEVPELVRFSMAIAAWHHHHMKD